MFYPTGTRLADVSLAVDKAIPGVRDCMARVFSPVRAARAGGDLFSWGAMVCGRHKVRWYSAEAAYTVEGAGGWLSETEFCHYFLEVVDGLSQGRAGATYNVRWVGTGRGTPREDVDGRRRWREFLVIAQAARSGLLLPSHFDIRAECWRHKTQGTVISSLVNAEHFWVERVFKLAATMGELSRVFTVSAELATETEQEERECAVDRLFARMLHESRYLYEDDILCD
jgi:hypothetical protein